MRKVSEYPQALKMFAKDVGAPDVLVADPHPSNKSKDVKAFCNKIGTTLRSWKNQLSGQVELSFMLA